MTLMAPGLNTEKHRPMTIGSSISYWLSLGPGTLSFFAMYKGWPALVSLTHVLDVRGRPAPAGNEFILQPASLDGGRDMNNLVATTTKLWLPDPASQNNKHEYGCAWLIGGDEMNTLTDVAGKAGFSLNIPGVGYMAGRMDACVGQRVVGIGRTSGVVRGTVLALAEQQVVPYPRYTAIGTTEYDNIPYDELGAVSIEAKGGDSGMPLFDADSLKLVGVIIAAGSSVGGSMFSHQRYIPDDLKVLGAS